MDDSCVRKLDVERYCAGELTGEAAAGFEAHLRSCASCGAYLAQLKKEREAFLGAHPFAEFLSARAAPVRAGPWYRRFLEVVSRPSLRPALAPALVVLVAVAVIPFIPGQENGIRHKGGESLSYIYKRGGAVHTAAPDDLFRPGDRVQIYYSADTDRYLTLFSVDGRGAVSFYQPDAQSAECSVRSGIGERIAYPASIELDSTRGQELVAAVFSGRPFDTNQIKKWIARTGPQGDMNALEKALKKNPPEKKGLVLTLMLKKG